jgi:hypothetical protein
MSPVAATLKAPLSQSGMWPTQMCQAAMCPVCSPQVMHQPRLISQSLLALSLAIARGHSMGIPGMQRILRTTLSFPSRATPSGCSCFKFSTYLCPTLTQQRKCLCMCVGIYTGR